MIHQYKLNGYNIVLDVYSGSVHSVDDLAYDVIKMYENNSREEIKSALLEKYKDVNPSESLYVDDRRHILQKAKEYGFNLLLMDRYGKFSESDFKTINNMNDFLEVLE